MERLRQATIGHFSTSPMDQAIEAVQAERQRQNAKWGEQNHELPHWMLILGEEFGEATKAVLEREVLLRDGPTTDAPIVELGRATAAVTDELVQVAAVAVAILECMQRRARDVAEARL